MAQRQNNSQSSKDPINNTEKAEKEEKAENGEGNSKKKELEELPPFEIVEGSRIPASSFMFQFKNVEYSSGRNKTILCYTVERPEAQIFHGYLEDEHVSAHAEEAFFTSVLPQFLTSGSVTVTCYVSSSPCVTCAASIAQCLRKNKTVRIQLAVARLFQWEEPEIRRALKGLRSAGCQVRMMRGADYIYVWKNFVEPDITLDDEGMEVVKDEHQDFIPWEDLEENSRYYEEKLAEILR
ncbi:apolipoprotein B mRNA editing enzyme, catalytic polypeptide-like 2 L homeolog [Xenopus laevis]|nr:apolipoprotein B mRNA editing enzyme, catalytic polypeptide-like 2 L homeolog [Xenopus laevis]AAH74467.1 MGC84761 protein [Xenopus laevis]